MALLPLLRGLLCGSRDTTTTSGNTVITRPGLFDATPDVTLSLLSPGPKVCVAVTGPDKGITSLSLQQQQQQPLGTDINWVTQAQQTHQHQQQQQQQQLQQSQHSHQQQQQQQQQQSHHHQQHQQHQQQQRVWGSAISLYDLDPLTGTRNGDPIADCFAAITYHQGAVLALADGVNWGERPKQAARAAVRGFCSSLHHQLAYTQGGRKLSSTAACAALRSAVLAAQQQVLAAEGTLATLVGAVVCPKRWGGGHVLLAVCVGDSPCYVWRAASGTVEEVTHLPPMHGFHRDPRVCPGCLGYAVGDSPDLSNITFSVTQLQQGDVVYLASDGIADNFDPVMRKQALASALPSKSPRASAAAQSAALAALNGQLDMSSHLFDSMCPASPATCHARAMNDMAMVLRGACSGQHGQQLHQGLTDLHSAQQQLQLLLQEASRCPEPVAVAKGSSGVQQGGVRTIQSIDASLASSNSSGGGSSKPDGLGTASASKNSAAGDLPAFADGAQLSPRAAVEALLAFAASVTDAQRRVLEDATSRSGTRGPELADILAGLPGKLDHAAAVAYKVGS